MTIWRVFVLLVLAVILWTPAQNKAQASELDRFPFTLAAGGFANRVDAEFTSTLDRLDPVSLSLQDLGMDDRATVFWTEGTWQFADRWQLNLSWNSFDSSGSLLAGSSGNYRELEWEVGAELVSEFDIDLAIANLSWTFHESDRTRLGIGLGLHTANLEFGLTTTFQVSINDNEFTEVVETVEEDVLAPLPNLALTGEWEITDELILRGYAGLISLSIDKYDGSLFSSRAALEWYPSPRFGLGAALQYLDVDLKIDQRNRLDQYDVRFFGPIIYASTRF